MARLSKEIVTEQVNILKDMVKTGEILKYSERDLENKLLFTRNTLRKHLRIIKQEIGTRDIKIISLNLMNILETIMQDLEKYWQKAREEENEQKIMYYMKQMFIAIDKFTDFLERFGIKDKVADKHDIRAIVLNSNIDTEAESNRILLELNG